MADYLEGMVGPVSTESGPFPLSTALETWTAGSACLSVHCTAHYVFISLHQLKIENEKEKVFMNK